MDKGEALALIRQGADAWNQNNEGLQARLLDSGKPTEAQENAWNAATAVNLSNEEFAEPLDLSGFEFLGKVTFIGARFRQPVNFRNVVFRQEARFDNAIFESDANFSAAEFAERPIFRSTRFSSATFTRAQFQRGATYEGSTFDGTANFDEVAFRDDCLFEKVRFKHRANFKYAVFDAVAAFTKADFDDDVDFKRSQFVDGAAFITTDFKGDASFEHTQFDGPTSFERADFVNDPKFIAMRSQSTFSLSYARFKILPDFAQAHFDEAPYLDSIEVERSRQNLSQPLRWRSLRKLAAQGLDHEREQLFFTYELRALRRTTDTPVPNPFNLLLRTKLVPGDNGKLERKEVWFSTKGLDPRPVPVLANFGRYWVGLFYQLTSNFGRSITLPMVWWVLSTAAFTALYAWGAEGWSWPFDTLNQACTAGSGSPLLASVALSLSRALIIPGLTHVDAVHSAYACLFPHPGLDEARLPDWLLFAGYAQTVLSATLLFLFFLGIRNAFRMR